MASEVAVANRSERDKDKKKIKLQAIRIEPAEGGFVVQEEINDWENRPDPVVFTDEDKMYDYISECLAKHEAGTYSKKETELNDNGDSEDPAMDDPSDD